MKKIKEILLLLVLFVVSFALFVVVYLPSLFVAGSDSAFVGGVNHLRLLISDRILFMAIINTVRKPLISSVVLIPLSCFILKNRIKFTRKNFYLTAFVTSFIISIVYLFTNAALYNILGYIFFPMPISFLCLIVFWIFELIRNVFKSIKKGWCK